MTDQVQQIKDRLNIVDIVGQYVKLTKAGKNYKGHSPFNKEKTPSFFVSPDKGMYYDFSSGQGGDIFSFVERMEGVDFKGALHILAEKAGITLQREHKGAREERERLLEILELTCAFYERQLKEHSSARTYIKERGIEDTTTEGFRLGYAPDSWNALHEHLTSIGHKEPDIEKAGLIKKSDKGSYYDRFRSRIIFPIFDASGKVIAFSGRIHGKAAKDEKNAKYLNSPETTLFDKSRILYGFDKAKQFIRKYDFTIFVEGQMDLVLSHQAGYGNTVAVSGTGLTEHHLLLIERLSKKLVLAFDADRAGIESCGRAATLALVRGIEVKVARIPEEKDPADCILEDLSMWKQIIKDSKHVVEFFLLLAVEKSTAEKWEKRKLITYVRDTVLPYITLVTSATERAHFEQLVSQELQISEDAVREDVTQLLHKSKPNQATYQKSTPPAEIRKKRPFSRKDDIEKTLSGFLFAEDVKKHSILSDDIIAEKAKAYNVPLETLFARYASKKDELIEESNRKYDTSLDPTLIMTTLMKDLGKIYVDDELEIVRQLQYDAEHGATTEDTDALEKRVAELSKLKKSLE